MRVAAGSGWAVSAPHTAAAEAAARAFARGGNAVDAALAAAAMLTVVYPNQCSLGGDLIALVADVDGTVHAVNATGRAPRAADPDAMAAGGASVPVYGPLTVTVPGVVSGWALMGERWGSRPLSEALADAEAAARDGVPVAPGLGRALAEEAARIGADPGLRAVFAPRGDVLRAGALVRQPRLADSIALLRADGPAALYGGPIGDRLVALLRAGGSAMTAQDLAGHRAGSGVVAGTVFDGREYLSVGGNSQGVFFLAGLHALELLRADGRDLHPLGESAGAIAAVLAVAAADRDALLGDADLGGDGAAARTAELLGAEYARSLLARSLQAGSVAVPVDHVPAAHGDTAAVTTADAEGRWVSLLQSVFHPFGAGILEPATGIVLHNRGSSFTLRPDAPNRLAGGRRPPHTLMPVLVREDGRIGCAVAAMGGRAQPQIQTELALALAAGAGVGDMVSRPRWVLGSMGADGQAGPAQSACLERDVPEPAARSIAARGLAVERMPAWDDGAGHAHAIRWRGAADGRPGVFEAAADPRADGSALAGPAPADGGPA